jgi:hypothetical protein
MNINLTAKQLVIILLVALIGFFLISSLGSSRSATTSDCEASATSCPTRNGEVSYEEEEVYQEDGE